MKTSGKCSKCGSSEIVVDATAVSNADPTGLSVYAFEKPGALGFKKWQSSALSACVCGKCGYVEFYAKDPDVLRKKKKA